MRKLTVDSTVTQILSFNSQRVAALVFNVGDYDVYVSEDRAEVAEKGFPLKAGMCLAIRKKDGDRAEKALYGVCPLGTTELRIWESYGEEEKAEEVS